MKKSKKAMSPVIGAVLMITFTLAIAGIVFIWIRNTAQKVGTEQNDVLCRDVDYNIGDVHCDNVGGHFLKFNAVNYAQDLTLMGFMITIEATGESKSFNSNPSEILPLKSASVSIDIDGVLSNINRVKIIPRVKSGQEIVNCPDKETIRVWSEITGCS